MVVKRFEIYYVNLEPTIGSEINKIRPCVILSPDEMNQVLNTVIVAPLTSTIREGYPTRIKCSVDGIKGQIALDQLRVIDKKRLTTKINQLDSKTSAQTLHVLLEMFR